MPTIRPATEHDLDRIYEIVALAFGPVCAAKLLEDRFGIIHGKPWVEHKAGSVVHQLRNHLDCVVVAEVDGRVAGFASYGYKGDTGMVGNNAVDPAFQGRGIGTRLIHRVLCDLRGRGVARFNVTTMEHDAPARRVYEKMGFQERSRSIFLTRQSGSEVEQERIDAQDTAALSQLKCDGYQEIARSVSYDMTLADFSAAELRLGL